MSIGNSAFDLAKEKRRASFTSCIRLAFSHTLDKNAEKPEVNVTTVAQQPIRSAPVPLRLREIV